MHPIRRLILLSLLALLCHPTLAREQAQMDFLLAAQKAPNGVVFEIVSNDPLTLNWALPRAKQHIEQLRQRFPQLRVAVVSHGREQFGLLQQQQPAFADVHQLSAQLIQAQIPVHVCRVQAAAAGFSATDFAADVDVSSSGPARIAQYLREGYVLVNIEKEGR